MNKRIVIPKDSPASASPWPNRVVGAITLVLPFFVLYWLVPFVGKYTIGNDYIDYWINMQMYLRFSISNGTFPLYAPGFNDGWTSSALTLGQLWHPISWIASLLPAYWNGYAHQIGTILRLVELGGTCTVIFLFLRKLRLTIPFAFVLSFITVYNLRMLDMFRYGASLENYTALLLLCTALGWFYLSPASRLLRFFIVVSTWLLVVGGHPQITYIGFLGAIFVCIFIPFFISSLLPGETPLEASRVLKFWTQAGILTFLGVLLASAYTLPFYFEYIKESFRGSGLLSFDWACSHQDTFAGILCNFFDPFFSEVSSAFGGSAFVLLAGLLPLAGVFYLRRAWPVFALWAGCVVVFVMAIGSNGPLYYYFWQYFPFARTFRVPGRLCVVLPFMFMLILAWMVQQKTVRLRLGKTEISFDPIVLVAVVALILLIASKGFDYAPLSSVRNIPAGLNKVSPVTVSLFFVCGLVSLVMLIFYRTSKNWRTLAGIVLAASVLIGTTAVLRCSTWITAGPLRTKTFAEMQLEQRQRLAYRPPTGDYSRTAINEHLQYTFLEPTLARVCRKYQPVKSRQESYQRLADIREIDLVYVEAWPGATREGKPDDSDPGIDAVELRYDSFNNLIFDVVCAKAGFFVFSFPFSPQWQAKVDGQERTIYRCNGIEQGVWLLPGRYCVEFRYRSPATVAGAVISCLVFIVVVWGFCAGAEKSRVRWLAATATVVLSGLLLVVWYCSLYQGSNIGTHYVWTSQQIQPNLSSHYNLAYGKWTTMNNSDVKSYTTESSVGVDGNRDASFGFITNTQEYATWRMDLNRIVQIAQIRLYKTHIDCSFPFVVLTSTDGQNWSLVQKIDESTDLNPWLIRLKNVTARYIDLRTLSRGRLALAEVEVYGPQADDFSE